MLLLPICPPRSTTVLTCYSTPNTCRFVVQDTLSGTSKFMARYFSRLSEALNLLPSTDTHGVSANIVEILSTKASSTVAARARDEFGRRTEDNDLRQQQVPIVLAVSNLHEPFAVFTQCPNAHEPKGWGLCHVQFA